MAQPRETARKRRAILVVCDGLGSEWLTAQDTPTLHSMRSRSRFACDHRAVFPSVTRVSAASIATGCFPARHGLEGNQMALVEGGRLTVHNVGASGFRKDMRRATGGTLRVVTLAERLANHGGHIAYSNVSPGAAYFLDPEHFGSVFHRAGSFLAGGAPAGGKVHLNVSHDLAGDTAMTARFCAEVIRGGEVPAATLWLANPDLTLHHAAPGGPEHRHALRTVDTLVASVIEAVEACRERDDTLLLVGSDHGHETIGASIHVGHWMAENGLGDELLAGSIAVAGQGTAALVYAMPEARAAFDRVMPILREQPWVGAMLVGDALHNAGLSLEGCLVAAIDTARSEEVNAHGVPGSRWLVEDGEAPPELGCGHHGGIGPQETRPFLMVAHPSLAAAEVKRTTSLVDIAPTILDYLAIAHQGMDGASLLTG